MTYEFLWRTYETERVKVLGVWSMFQDDDLDFRPHPTDQRGRGACGSRWYTNASVRTFGS